MVDMLRILILEDHASDAELIERELRSAGLVFTSRRVETREAFLKAMADFSPDIVLSDYSLPQFTGGEALALVRERFPETPVIIVTGSMTEETAVECMKNGADNYVIKEHLVRLGPAVISALENKRVRKEKKVAEDTLRLAALQWRTTFDALSDAVCLLDAEGKIVRCNEAMQVLVSKPWTEILSHPCHQIIHNASEPIEDCPRIRMLKSGQKETALIQAGERWFDVRVDPIMDEQCRSVGAVQIMSDITERKRAEEERLKLEAQMQQTQKLESLGVLAGGIAHDFSNLLMGVMGNAELALKELPSSLPGCARIQEIQAEARRATDLCRQLLAYSGKGRFVVEPIDLNGLVKEMGQMLEVSVSKKAVLQYHLSKHPLVIEADATQLRQIIMNLVINASDAVGDKSGYITIATGSRQCDRTFLHGASLSEPLPEGSYVFIEVSDAGSGMSPETRAKIFEPFFTTKFTGRGLGLAAALGIVKGHKGAITVASELGKGTTFTVLFPVSLQPIAVAPAKVAAKDKDKWRGRGTILVVDDEKNVRVIAKIHLENAGFRVLTAENGRKGLQLFREHSGDIVLVLLDMTMPEMGGEEVFQKIIRIKENARVILSSGYSEHDIISRFDDKGLAGFIQKPYERADLIGIVRQALEKKEA